MLRQLALHEGIKLHYYLDTLGNTTNGIGFNVTARGVHELERMIGRKLNAVGDITTVEACQVCLQDIARVERAVLVYFPEYASLNDVRKRVCLDLAFNIGFKALGFKHCIADIKIGDWSSAAVELHKAHWALQVEPSVDLAADAAAILNERVRGRADRLARMLLTGQDSPDFASVVVPNLA